MKKHKPETFNADLYKKLWKHIQEYYQYHAAIKYIGDYLTPEELEKNGEILRLTRIKYAEPLFEESEKTVKKIIALIARKMGLEEELVCFTREDVCNYFDNGSIPSKTELLERKRKTIFLAGDLTYYMFTGKNADLIESFLYAEKHEGNLKGTVAFKGVVKGRVKIIQDPTQVEDFQEGDVLVSGMTRPDYLPFMKLAGAIVTDAGGILSHTAISARELQKPCVIGTKVATKILKDGDIVEVDAEKGIVRIIK